MKRIILPTALLLVATLSVSAQDDASPRDGRRAIRRIEHRLNVTDVQRAQAKAILAAERPALQQLHTQLAAEHTELAQQPVFDEARVRAITAKYADANTAALVEREKLRTELLAILTPDQLKKVADLRSRFGVALDERLETLGDNL